MAINFFDQSIPFWNTNTTYAQYEIVSYLGIIYSSKSSQAGNNPASDTTNTYWSLAGGGGVPNGLVGTTTVSAMKVVYATSTGTIQHADYSTELTTTAIGISTYGNTTGLTVAYQPSGLLKSFSTGMTPGLPLFLGASGAVITDPTTIPIGYYRVMIGYAINATDIMINLSEPVQVLANNVVKVGLGRVTQWPITTASLPSNMIPLDGRAISRTFYADLYALWGTTYGTGDGTSTFNVIDWTSLNVKDSTGTTIGYWVVQSFPDTVIVTSTAVASATSYIPNGDFENSTTGWATYYNGSATASPNGTITGTATNLNFARNTTTPLFGTGDFKLNQTGTSKGAGLTYDFTLDPGLFGQVMSLSFYYKTIDVSGTAYVDSDFSVFLYDITNSSFIPLSTSGISRSTSASKFYSSWFPSTSTRYRIFIHQTSTTTGVYSLELDRVDVSVQTTPNAAAVGGWKTAIVTLGSAGNAVCELMYRRVGETFMGKGAIRIGSTAPTGLITFDPLTALGLTADYSKQTIGTGGNSGSYQRVGIAIAYKSDGSKKSIAHVARSASSLTTFYFVAGEGSTYGAPNDLAVSAGTFTFGVNDAISFDVEVPIAQWTTNVNLATDFTEYVYNTSTSTTTSDTTSFASGIGGAQIQAITARLSRTVQFSRPIQPSDKLTVEINTGKGWVDIGNSPSSPDSSSFVSTYVIQNGVYYGILLQPSASNQAIVTFGQYPFPAGATYGSAGQTWTAGTTPASGYYWRVRKVSNGNMAETPPVVRAEYTGAVAVVPTGTPVIVNAATKVEDTQSAVSNPSTAWQFTAPISGVYEIDVSFAASVASSTTGVSLYLLYKNGSSFRNIAKVPIGNGTGCDGGGSVTVRLIAGDYIQIYISSGNNTSGNISNSRFCVTRIGS
jgi:microcystin-dependent protein